MNIENILLDNEGKTLEFKENVLNLSGIVKTIVAFSNTAGGKIVIGVKDAHKIIVGVDNVLKVEEKLSNVITDKIHPKIVPNIEIINYRNKQIVIIEVYPGPSKPYYLKGKSNKTEAYYRIGSTNRLADQYMVREMERSVTNGSYDETPMTELNPEDIDFQVASGFFKGIKSLNEKHLETLGIIKSIGNKKIPTFAGVLLFGKNIQDILPDYKVQMGFFKGRDKSTIIDTQETQESPLVAIEECIKFLKKHLSHSYEIKELKRQEEWEVPMVVLREAVLNAFLHTDYAQFGSSIRVSVFSDRVEIENPGILPFGLTIEDLKQGVSKIRNRVLSRVFKELKLVETWGSGIQRMIYECKNKGLPEPILEEIGTHFRITFLKQRKEIKELDNQNAKILKLFDSHKYLTNKEISVEIGISQRSTRDRLKFLVQNGYLKELAVSPFDPNKKYTLS